MIFKPGKFQRIIDRWHTANKIYRQVQVIQAEEINAAWDKVVNKKARYKYVM